ncbi:MAG: hypothetical protein ACR2JW_15230 [Thermomicrobiales bacterium]
MVYKVSKAALLAPIVAVLLAACTATGPTVAPIQPTTSPVPPTTVATSPATQASAGCPVTPFTTTRPPDANTAHFTETWYGNDALWAGLAPSYQGKWFVGGLKVLWWHSDSGKLTITGRRLDGAALPVDASIPDGYSQIGYQATGIDVPTPGCWEITGKVATRDLRFVVYVNPEGCLPANLRTPDRPSPPPCTTTPA